MQRIASAFAIVCAIAFALVFSPGSGAAQVPRDPLIDPPAGGFGSRFQAVGQSGWTPGEQVTLRFGFTTSDPLAYSGPWHHERQATVLRDGTWSFPVVVNAELFPFALDRPGFIVVQAQSPSKTAVNAYVFTVDGVRPAGAEAIAPLGFGPGAPGLSSTLASALFALATGALLLTAGALRRHEHAAGIMA